MIQKNKTDVSIIAPNYNNGRYLMSFIQSVIDSSVWPKELIIIDDGSTDESLMVLAQFSDLGFLKIIRFEKNLGLTAALNAGLEAASGKYIMRADPDDVLLPNRIEVQYNYMESKPETDVLGSNVIYFSDKDGSHINTSNFPLNHDEIVNRFRKGEHGLQHPTAFVKAEVYKTYRYQKIFPAEDYEIFSRMVRDGRRFANISEPLYLMRVHQGSSTSNIRLKDIRQTFRFRDEIFKTKTGLLKIWLYFNHIHYYRKYQLTENMLTRYFSLFLAALFHPVKVLNRFKK
jgi:glycosyltransferase involved in cell wall biosynthesis